MMTSSPLVGVSIVIAHARRTNPTIVQSVIPITESSLSSLPMLQRMLSLNLRKEGMASGRLDRLDGLR